MARGKQIDSPAPFLTAEEHPKTRNLSSTDFQTMPREIFTSLDEESQAEIWFGIGKGRSKIDKYGEAKEAFEEILKIFPEDEDVQTELEQIEGMLMGEEQE